MPWNGSRAKRSVSTATGPGIFSKRGRSQTSLNSHQSSSHAPMPSNVRYGAGGPDRADRTIGEQRRPARRLGPLPGYALDGTAGHELRLLPSTARKRPAAITSRGSPARAARKTAHRNDRRSKRRSLCTAAPRVGEHTAELGSTTGALVFATVVRRRGQPISVAAQPGRACTSRQPNTGGHEGGDPRVYTNECGRTGTSPARPPGARSAPPGSPAPTSGP